MERKCVAKGLAFLLLLFLGVCTKRGFTSDCDVTNIKYLFPSVGGFAISPQDENLVVHPKPDSKGVYQLYRKRMDSGEERCLTCSDIRDGPLARVHKGLPVFHPDGRHIILKLPRSIHVKKIPKVIGSRNAKNPGLP